MFGRKSYSLLSSVICTSLALASLGIGASDASAQSADPPTSEIPLPAAQQQPPAQPLKETPPEPPAPAQEAQPQPASAPASAATEPVPASPAPADAAPQPGPTEEAASASAWFKRHGLSDPLASYSIGIALGVGHVGTGKLNNPAYKPEIESLTPAQRLQLQAAGLIGGDGCGLEDKRCRTTSRQGFQLSIPVQLGGSIVGFRFEPVFTFADAAKAYGLYLGPTFDFHVWNPLYLGFGLGVKAQWVKADGWKYAGDVFGRFPLHAIWYLHSKLAFVTEFGFGWGASVFVSEQRNSVTINGKRYKSAAYNAGIGRTWDLSFGLRFP